MKKGKWIVYARYAEIDKVALMFVIHESIDEGMFRTLKWEKETKGITVDSAQMGVYDNEHFRNDADTEGKIVVDYAETNKGGDRWYGLCCKTSNSDDGIGCIVGGAVCSADIRDELYNIFTVSKNGKKVGIKIVTYNPEESIERHSEDDEFDKLRAAPKTYVPENDDESNPEQMTISTKLDPKFAMPTESDTDSTTSTPINMKKTKDLTKEETRARTLEIAEYTARKMGEHIPIKPIKTYVTKPIAKKDIASEKYEVVMRSFDAIKKNTMYSQKARNEYYKNNKYGRKHYDSDEEPKMRGSQIKQSDNQYHNFVNKQWNDDYDSDRSDEPKPKRKIKNKKI